ncbi:MAG TPA: hypothetical protein VMF68_07505 [Spirochaetia bacterium]|nr:hypothetical protein [Spirochaetia bacterium]HTZ51487.1 hypothetical protein [Spirochaetia bacterium]
MKRYLAWGALGAVLLTMLLLAGCSTLNVTTPDGMFLSTGDYVPGVKTLGVIQEKSTVVAPIFIYDLNKINQALYERLIQRVKDAGADGIMDVRFSSKLSPLSYLSVFIVPVFDFYAEGIAFKKQ